MQPLLDRLNSMAEGRLGLAIGFLLLGLLGGWLGGDELPLQRRLSVGGSGTLPGFDFRRFHEQNDVGMCTSSEIEWLWWSEAGLHTDSIPRLALLNGTVEGRSTSSTCKPGAT